MKDFHQGGEGGGVVLNGILQKGSYCSKSLP